VDRDRWEHLGRRVTAERVRLGYRSLAAFAAAADLSTTTLDNIEHGRKTSYDPGTIGALERALGWLHGSVERVLTGRDPEIAADADLEALLEAWPRLSPGARRMLRLMAVEGARVD
jgi:transcriptional regulator with XRE-family HTH domain